MAICPPNSVRLKMPHGDFVKSFRGSAVKNAIKIVFGIILHLGWTAITVAEKALGLAWERWTWHGKNKIFFVKFFDFES